VHKSDGSFNQWDAFFTFLSFPRPVADFISSSRSRIQALNKQYRKEVGGRVSKISDRSIRPQVFGAVHVLPPVVMRKSAGTEMVPVTDCCNGKTG
jgi:hypothetical protein